ncbi:hypothetical protein [Nocardia alni]|uniref:hypothetical protein n=1 Tax=Nocardia alni TaxID=2815723 RepID=UPI001C24C834|nr:hypothetical protein [Nocardia alni]
MNDLATGFGTTATGVEAVTTTKIAPQIAAALPESATSTACHTGAHIAHTALGILAGHYRTIRGATATSADTFERTDADHAQRIHALIQPR